ncbi:MAG: ECF-type sigma factor [Planctomycetaceae bacterium]
MDPANRHPPTEADSIDADAPSDAAAAEELFTLVYEELRRLAECQLASEPTGVTLQATALVHEAYLKLSRTGRAWSDRRHFFAAAAEAMRRILVDHARRRKRLRRGGGRTRVETDLGLLPEVRPDDEVLALAEALSLFEQVDERAALLVKLRYFAGLTLDEAAVVIGVSRATVTRDWSFAKAWLRRALTEIPEVPTPAESAEPPGDVSPGDVPPEPQGSP